MDERQILGTLADRLDEMGFLNYREPIEEWLQDGREAWAGGVHEMLGALRRTVWQDFGNMGETPQEWLDEHPRPDIEDPAYEDQFAFDEAEEAWRAAAREAAKGPYHEAEQELLAAGIAIRGATR